MRLIISKKGTVILAVILLSLSLLGCGQMRSDEPPVTGTAYGEDEGKADTISTEVSVSLGNMTLWFTRSVDARVVDGQTYWVM